ncbi:MAG: hypothetical protein LRY55_13340 [Leadbetterella sp.]|nr:hypothetical protein [Leadbetterella sp.]
MEIEQKIKEVFDPYFNAPLDAWKLFTDLGEVITTEKDQSIKKAHTTEKYLSFILKGSGGILLWKSTNFVCIDLCYDEDFFRRLYVVSYAATHCT